MAGRIDDYKNHFISGNLKKDIKAFQSIFENDVTFRIKRVCARKNVDFDAALLYIDGMVDSIMKQAYTNTEYSIRRERDKKIEEEMDYPGQIKVNIIRETRTVDYAK